MTKQVITAAFLIFPVLTMAQNYDESKIPDYTLPELLLSSENLEIKTSKHWEDTRRPEILTLFANQVYGEVPLFEYSVDHEVKTLNEEALGGSAILRQVDITLKGGGMERQLSILIVTPKGAKSVPVFLGLNFYGNQAVMDDSSIPVTNNYIINKPDAGVTDNKASEATRGMDAEAWQAQMLIENGYGLVTLHCGDIDPDHDDGFQNGVHSLAHAKGPSPSPEQWGTVSGWAWGLSRVMDYLESDPLIDPKRAALIGHSRLGKTALWAGATDDRFAVVISNNSGCGGAALSRRRIGETVKAINTSFPHWFSKNFHSYNDREDTLPIDQHMLIALMAPRPVYVASAADDRWADPKGEFVSWALAAPVFKLYGEDTSTNLELPDIDEPLRNGRMGYHIRSGGHAVTQFDWQQYLDFVDQFLK